MPLQKTPPSNSTTTEHSNLTQKQANQHRHVSFHSSSEWEGGKTPSGLTKDNNQVSYTSRDRYGYGKNRRSLPAQGFDAHEQPSILVTAADDSVPRHPGKDLSGPALGNRPKASKRASMNPSHDGGLQVDTTKSRRHSSGPGSHSQRAPAAATSRERTGELAMGTKTAAEITRNDTPVNGRWSQHGGRHRISLGSSSALPSMSPLPVMKPKSAYVNGRRNQQQLLQNSATMHRNGVGGRAEARLHHGHIERHLEIATGHAESLKLASTKSNPHLNVYRDPLSRPRSTPANGFVQTPPLFRSPARTRSSAQVPQEYPFLASPSESVKGERRPRSFHPGEDARARSSSAHSTATVLTSVSNGTSHSQRSRRRYSDSRTSQSSRNRHQRQVVDQERLDALASLTGSTNQRGSVNADSLRLVREREKLLRWKAEREKMEFERREREKIRERVRLANLKEMQRSKELEEEAKRKKRGRGCWSGIFGW